MSDISLSPSSNKFSSGREASDIYKAILGLSVMKRSILAALIVAVSLSVMVYVVPGLVAGTNFRLLQEAHAQVTVTINNALGGGSIGSSTPTQGPAGPAGPAGPMGPMGATGPAGPAGSAASGGSTEPNGLNGSTGQAIGPGQVPQVNPGVSTLLPSFSPGGAPVGGTGPQGTSPGTNTCDQIFCFTQGPTGHFQP